MRTKYVFLKIKVFSFLWIIFFGTFNNNDLIKVVKIYKEILDKYEISKDNENLFKIKKDINQYKNIKLENIHTIHIGITINDQYTYPCIVLITSLLENRNQNTIYHIHIVTPKVFNSTYILKINSLIKKYGEKFLKISFIPIKNDIKVGNKTLGIQEYRLIFSSLFPDIDKIIYCDADVINFEDLTEFYNLELKDNIYFRGSLDHSESRELLKPYGIINSERYINSGVILMNLKSMKKNRVEEKLINLFGSFNSSFADQTIINVVGYNHIKPFPLKYACFNFLFYFILVRFNNLQTKKYRESEAAIKEAYNQPFLLHFPTSIKPWRRKYRDRFFEYWWYFAKKTDFYEEILSFSGYTNRRVIRLLKKIPRNGGLLNRKKN